MSKSSKIIYFCISTVFFVILNKFLTNRIIEVAADRTIANSIVKIEFIKNTGAAFSILENATLFLIIFSIFATCIILFYYFRNIEKLSAINGFWTALLVSGIFCNLHERIEYGYVRDFFLLNFINFPVFNISDICINVGVIALIIIIIKNNYLKNEDHN